MNNLKLFALGVHADDVDDLEQVSDLTTILLVIAPNLEEARRAVSDDMDAGYGVEVPLDQAKSF